LTFQDYRPSGSQYDIHQYGNIIDILISMHILGNYRKIAIDSYQLLAKTNHMHMVDVQEIKAEFCPCGVKNLAKH